MRTFLVGQSADGTGWTDVNNKCRGCSRRMPLPESHGKYCPQCGTLVPSGREMTGKYEYTGPMCGKCGAKVEAYDKFCTNCGHRADDMQVDSDACGSCGRSPCEARGPVCRGPRRRMEE